jgi:hypothetical protein
MLEGYRPNGGSVNKGELHDFLSRAGTPCVYLLSPVPRADCGPDHSHLDKRRRIPYEPLSTFSKATN